MLRSLMNLLTKAMPVLLLLFIILATCQLFILSPLSVQKIHAFYEKFIDLGRPVFLPLGLVLLILVCAGCGYEFFSNKLARQGLRRRQGPLTRLLDRFTCRQKVNELLERSYQDSRLDAGEFAAALRARMIGQDYICEDIAQQIKLRLATRKHLKPTAIFLLLGASGAGKKFLAQQIARYLKRPCFIFKPGGENEKEQTLLERINTTVKQNPQAVLVIANCHALSEKDWSQISCQWLDQNNSAPSFQDIIFIFTERVTDIAPCFSPQDIETKEDRRITGNRAAHNAQIQPALISQCDRIFLFQPLGAEDLARISALALENMIKDYGLNVEAGGLDPNLLLPLIRQQKNHVLTAHEIVRLVEDQIGDSLIAMRQQDPTPVHLTLQEREGRNILIVKKSSPAQERLTPVIVRD